MYSKWGGTGIGYLYLGRVWMMKPLLEMTIRIRTNTDSSVEVLEADGSSNSRKIFSMQVPRFGKKGNK